MTTPATFRLWSLLAFVIILSVTGAQAGPGPRMTTPVKPHLRLSLGLHKARGHSARATVLTGGVLGANGMPLAGAWVSVEGQTARARTNAHGDFSLKLASSGPVVLNCSARGYAPQALALATASQPTDVYFALQPAPMVLAQVRR